MGIGTDMGLIEKDEVESETIKEALYSKILKIKFFFKNKKIK